MKKNRIAIIDNSIDHSIYNPIRHWKNYLETDFRIFKAIDKQFPDIQDFTHFILTGSEASVLQREDWANDEINLIKEMAEGGVSILGSCYGHQLLAVALTGPQHVQKCVNPEIGWISIEMNGADDFFGKKAHAFCFSSHLDEVRELPDEFLVFASSDRCQIQAFRLRNRPVWGLQIHPEICVVEAKKYLNKRIKNNHEPLHLFKAALNSRPRDSGLIHPVVQNFLG